MYYYFIVPAFPHSSPLLSTFCSSSLLHFAVPNMVHNYNHYQILFLPPYVHCGMKIKNIKLRSVFTVGELQYVWAGSTGMIYQPHIKPAWNDVWVVFRRVSESPPEAHTPLKGRQRTCESCGAPGVEAVHGRRNRLPSGDRTDTNRLFISRPYHIKNKFYFTTATAGIGLYQVTLRHYCLWSIAFLTEIKPSYNLIPSYI